MKKNLAKRMVAAAILTSWLASPGFVLAGERVEITGSTPVTQPGISDSHYSGNYGGAVYNSGTDTTLSGEFSNNYAQVEGGAIFNAADGVINVTNGSKFDNNSIVTFDPPQSYGGAIYNNGSLIFEGGTESDHTVFSNNTAAVGGAIYNSTTGDPLHFGDYTEFSNNTATGAIGYNGKNTGTGGAIYARSGFTTGDNLLFKNNQSGNHSYGGGAISIDLTNTASMPDPVKMGSVSIGKNAHFIGNHTDLSVDGSRGGAILIDAAPKGVTLGEGAYFEGNQAQAGGAIYTQAKITLEDGAVFKNNSASNNAFGLISGGAVSNWFGQVNLGKNTQFLSNTSAGNGGAIDNFGTVTIGKTSDGVLDAENVVFDGNHSDKNGGAINNYNKVEIGKGTGFVNNTAAQSGGAIANGSMYLPVSGGIDLKGDITIGDNTYFGQAILNEANELIGGKNGNTAVQNGGAIFNTGLGSAITIGKNVLFAANSANQGGAISNYDGGELTIDDDVYFAYNHANSVGGAISNVGSSTNTAKLIIGNNASFVGNTSGTQGGAVHNQRAEMTIGDNALFYQNIADGYGGGAVYQDTDDRLTSLTIGDGAKFIQNKTLTSHGGAVMNFNAADGAKLTIGNDAVFSENTAKKNGGAIANFGGIVEIGEGSQYLGNKSEANGGAIYNSAYGATGSQLTIKGGHVNSEGTAVDTIFQGNIASGLGGAIFNDNKLVMDVTNGNIIFKDNFANSIANDIYMESNSTLEINGSNTVSFGGGFASDAGAAGADSIVRSSAQINNNGASLVLESGSKNADFKGYYNQNSGSVTVNSEFFGGTSNILSGDVNLNSGADIVAGSNVVMSTGTNIYINNDPDKIGKVIINGEVDSFTNGAGTITLAGGELVINGDQSDFTGKFTQNGGIDTSTTITADGTFFGGTNEIKSGKLVVKDGASLSNDIVIKDYSVALDLDGRELLLSDGGIVIEGNNQAAGAHSITGSLNLENTEVKVDATTGIQSDVYVANGSTITNTDGTKDVTVGGSGHDVTLSLGSGAITSDDQTLNVSDGSTINLTPMDSLNLHAEITGGADAMILVDGTELKSGEGKYDVGTVLLNADNSGFVGSYTQNDGTVIVNEGSTFFGGTNNVNTNEMDGSSGSLILNDGALLASDVNINGNASSDVLDLANVTFKGSTGEITQDNITSGEFNYAAAESASGDGVNVNNAGVIFSNNTIISDLDTTQNALVVSTNGSEDKGVRFLGFAEGSGVKGDILLNHGTGLAYFDGAYIENDSSLVMAGADLIFANDKTNINYNPEIIGEGTITKGGMGTTTIQSSLNEEIDIVAQSGALNLVSADTQALGDIAVGDVGEIDPDETTAIVNIAGTKSDLTIGDIEVAGKNAVLNIIGNATAGDTVVNKGTLGVFGQSSLSSLSLGSTLDMLGNNQINNLNIAGDFTLTDNSNFRFDVDPRSKTTDTINASGSLINTNADPAGDPYKMLITGINFTQSPIDRQVNFDINNILTAGGVAETNVVKLQEGGIIANSQMGRYLITSSGESNILSASLIDLNPQMYRGQVATVASYANQLVVNNILFDHMNILANDLIARDTNANRYAAANPLFAPYQYSKKDGDLWYKAYGNFERISMTQGLNVGNNAYGSIIGADFPLISLSKGWSLVPTAYIAYNGGHQTFDGVSMYQNGAQVGAMATAYKDNWITSLLAYGGGYANDMSVHGPLGGGSDTTGNWFAGVASKTAYNYHLPHDLVLQPTALVSYNIFGNQNYHSNFGNMSMNTGFLNGINVAPGVNLIWNKKTFSLYATAQLVFNIMGDVSGKAGNIDLNDVRMKTTYFEYGIGAMKKFKDRFTGYVQITLRNGYRTGIGFQGGLQWKIGK